MCRDSVAEGTRTAMERRSNHGRQPPHRGLVAGMSCDQTGNSTAPAGHNANAARAKEYRFSGR